MRGEEARVRDAFCGGERRRMGGRRSGTCGRVLLGVGGALERGQGVRRVWPWLCRVGVLVPVDLQRPTRTLL